MPFLALNAGAGICVLSTIGDSRWSAGDPPSLTAPSFAETPVVGEYLVPLDLSLRAVVGEVNDFLAVKHALPIALDFLTTSGMSILALFPLAIIAVIISIFVVIRRKADLKKYRATVDQLQIELEQVKLQITDGNFAVPSCQSDGDATEVLPRLAR
ncbi:hypothetical protein [Paeniglutamicibacter terrestris]|uniref:Uncharacterized protein n=1 Tax=Paeniglutamicibacter terrestris TaxID=2723403 RepID=A0ABX1G9C3_9MICC|nr:hypothetical protein [Paeniglutamicibacter terrestris]NKG22007.1 hypothetical protein [Paeniglutamicibacter terrestris]